MLNSIAVESTLSFLKWCFHLDKACNYTSWLGHCSQELQLIYDELPPFVNHVVRLWMKTFPPFPPLPLPYPPQTLLLFFFFLPAHFWVAKPKTQQSGVEKYHVHGGDNAMRRQIGSSAHPLVSLWDLLAFLVVVLRLGFLSLHFRPLKLSFFFAQQSAQWSMPCVKPCFQPSPWAVSSPELKKLHWQQTPHRSPLPSSLHSFIEPLLKTPPVSIRQVEVRSAPVY